jgi:hypothetical protein
MQAHFKHLCSKRFSMILRFFQFNKFWLLQLPFENLGVHQDFNSKVGAHLGVWGFIPSQFHTLPGTWNVIPNIHFWLAPLQTLALVISPKLGLWHITSHDIVITWQMHQAREWRDKQPRIQEALKIYLHSMVCTTPLTSHLDYSGEA